MVASRKPVEVKLYFLTVWASATINIGLASLKKIARVCTATHDLAYSCRVALCIVAPLVYQ